MMRGFFSISLPQEMRKTLTCFQAGISTDFPTLRWVGEDAFHLTLRFLGEISREFAESVGKACASRPAPIAPFQVEMVGSGWFPEQGPPRILWIGVEEGEDGLRRLFRHLEDILAGLGIKGERRRFSPHLTLGRVREGGGRIQRRDLEPFRARRWGRFLVQDYQLMESRLATGGARYSVVKRFPLGCMGGR